MPHHKNFSKDALTPVKPDDYVFITQCYGAALFFAAPVPALGKNFDAAPASTLLYSKPTF
jgi:hypothetical protein